MTVDEMIDKRWNARITQNWKLADEYRKLLDEQLVFTFDHKEYQEVHYLTESYFKKMSDAGFTDKRKYVEYRMKRDRQAESVFNAWLYTTNEQRKSTP